jgi:glutaredoxin 2
VRHGGDVDHSAQARCHAQGFKSHVQIGGLTAGLVQVIVLRSRVDDPDAQRAAVAAVMKEITALTPEIQRELKHTSTTLQRMAACLDQVEQTILRPIQDAGADKTL